MHGMTEFFKSQTELKDAEGRRTTFVVRMSLAECNALLDAASKGAEEMHKVPLELEWVLNRIVQEQRALIEERTKAEEI